MGRQKSLKFSFGVGLALVLFTCFFNTRAFAFTLKDNYENGDSNGECAFYGSIFCVSTFVVSSDYTLTNFELYFAKSPETLSGNIEFTLYACDIDHKPTGSPLSTGEFLADNVTAYPTKDWILVSMSETNLESGSEYCLKEIYPDGNGTHLVNHFGDSQKGNSNGMTWWVSGSYVEDESDSWYRVYGDSIVQPEESSGEVASTTADLIQEIAYSAGAIIFLFSAWVFWQFFK